MQILCKLKSKAGLGVDCDWDTKVWPVQLIVDQSILSLKHRFPRQKLKMLWSTIN